MHRTCRLCQPCDVNVLAIAARRLKFRTSTSQAAFHLYICVADLVSSPVAGREGAVMPRCGWAVLVLVALLGWTGSADSTTCASGVVFVADDAGDAEMLSENLRQVVRECCTLQFVRIRWSKGNVRD